MPPTVLVKVLAVAGTFVATSGLWASIYLSNIGTTIRDKVAEEGLELITKLGDYKFHLFEHKNNEELKTAIEKKDIDFEQHVNDLKKWCDSNTRGWSSRDKKEVIFKNVKNWCTTPTIRTLWDKVGGDLHDDNWQDRYTHFAGQTSESNDFLEALKKAFSEFDPALNSSAGGEKLQSWCDSSKWLKIYEAKDYRTADNFKKWCIKT